MKLSWKEHPLKKEERVVWQNLYIYYLSDVALVKIRTRKKGPQIIDIIEHIYFMDGSW